MHARRFTIALVIASVALTIAPLTAASVVRVSATDDDIPGVALPTSPVAGTLDYTTDEDDVYQVDLNAGQWVYAMMKGSSATDFDLYLWGPDATSVKGQVAPAAYSERHSTSTERVIYQSPSDGTHYLDAWAFDGVGSYTITYGFPTLEPTIEVTAPATCAWGDSASITGTMTASSAPAAGVRVDLYAKPSGAERYELVTYAKSDSNGAFKFSVKPTRRTYYRVSHFGSQLYLPETASALKITPQARLTTPLVPTGLRHGVAYDVVGYLRPHHKAGAKDVKIRCYLKQGNEYVWKKTVLARNYDHRSSSGTITKYKARLMLPSAGYWRIRAFIDGDSIHVDTWSPGSRYRTVK